MSMNLLIQDLNYPYLPKKTPIGCRKLLALGSERNKRKINIDSLIEHIEKELKKTTRQIFVVSQYEPELNFHLER